MKISQQFLACIALGTGLLFALPGLAQADNDRPRVGVNLSFGVPIYDSPAYVYAPPRPAYIYAPPRVVYYGRGYEGRDYDSWDDRPHWRHHDHDHGRWGGGDQYGDDRHGGWQHRDRGDDDD
jgi:hypothetical protein